MFYCLCQLLIGKAITISLYCHQQSLHLIKEMDQDGDGQLSVTEILQNQDIFINSEVTDYGRHLHLSHDEL